jgi:hypothetical protein
VTREEVRHDQPGPVVQPALGGQLPHADVDNREPGASLLPRRQLVRRVPRPVAARAQLHRGEVRSGGEDLGVELGPGHLPRGPFGDRLPLEDFDAGQAAEVQIGGQPAGGVRGEVVVDLVVAAGGGAQPGGQPGPPGAFHARG